MNRIFKFSAQIPQNVQDKQADAYVPRKIDDVILFCVLLLLF